jgi:hypothetical protein
MLLKLNKGNAVKTVEAFAASTVFGYGLQKEC